MFQQLAFVFLGGAAGAVLREFLMLTIPAEDGFPYSILAANVVASFVLGLMTSLGERGVLGSSASLFVGTGLTGGMSTFSSFAYATFVLLTASETGAAIGIAYAVASLLIGFLSVLSGLKLGLISDRGSDAR